MGKIFKATNNFRWALVHKGQLKWSMAGGLENGTDYAQFLQQAWECAEDGEIDWRFLPMVELNTKENK